MKFQTLCLPICLMALLWPPGGARVAAAEPPPAAPKAAPADVSSVAAKPSVRPASPAPVPLAGETCSSLDRPDPKRDQELLAAGTLRFEEADLPQVLAIYQELSGRTVVRSTAMPAVRITLRTQAPLSRRGALQALDSVLAQNGITMILQGSQFVKAVPSAQAPTEAVPVTELTWEELPESASYTCYVVELDKLDPSEIVQMLQPLASKLPNTIMAIKTGGVLVLRDYASNIRRMMELIERLEGRIKPGNSASAAGQPPRVFSQRLQQIVKPQPSVLIRGQDDEP